MSRGLEANLVAQSKSAHVRLVLFVKLEFDSGTLYLHNGVGSYTFDSATWSGLGDFGDISSVKESGELAPYELELMLSGLDVTMANEVLTQNYFGRPVTLYIGAVDIAAGVVLGQLVGDPVEIWAGKMDVARMALGEENAIVVTCENEFSRLDKNNGRIMSDADLQNEYPGDLLLEYLHDMVDRRLVWRGQGSPGQLSDRTTPGNFDSYNFRG